MAELTNNKVLDADKASPSTQGEAADRLCPAPLPSDGPRVHAPFPHAVLGREVGGFDFGLTLRFVVPLASCPQFSAAR